MKIENSIITPKIINNDVNKVNSTSGFDKILEEAKQSGDTTPLKDACNELEAVFINMMMKNMRPPESDDDDSFFKKSESEKFFEEMLDEEYSKKMSKAGGIGISDMLFDQLSKTIYNNEDEKKVSSFEIKG